MKSTTRPFGIIVISVILVLAGILSLIGGFIPSAYSLSVESLHLGFMQFIAPVLPLFLIALGLFYLGLTYGLWRGYRWAWSANVVFILVHIVADIGFVASRSFAIDKMTGLAIIVGMLIYLLLPRVRAYYFQKHTYSSSVLP